MSAFIKKVWSTISREKEKVTKKSETPPRLSQKKKTRTSSNKLPDGKLPTRLERKRANGIDYRILPPNTYVYRGGGLDEKIDSLQRGVYLASRKVAEAYADDNERQLMKFKTNLALALFVITQHNLGQLIGILDNLRNKGMKYLNLRSGLRLSIDDAISVIQQTTGYGLTEMDTEYCLSLIHI